MRELLEDIKLSKISYLVEKLEKRNLNEKLKTFKTLEKQKITKRIGLYLIENSTRDFGVNDEFGGINSSLIELCFKEYYVEYNDAIREVFKDLPEKTQDRVLNLLTTRFELESLQLYTELVLKYYKNRENIPIGELVNKPLAYPYVFPDLFKALKFDIERNNIIILLNQYLTSGVVLKEDIKKNKKIITDSICKLFEKGLKYKFKDTYSGLHNKEYKNLRYFLELAVNIEYYVSSKKTKDYLTKLLKTNDNQLKLFILDNYIRKCQNLKRFNFDPIIKDKASRYALFELLTIYEKNDLLSKKKIMQSDLALSDLYTNFVIATAYTNEPKNMKFVKTYIKDDYEYYIFKFDYKHKYNNIPNEYLTNYICNQLGIDKHIGEDVTNKFIGISGGYTPNSEKAIISKRIDKLLVSKIDKDSDIDKVVDDLLKEEIKEIPKEEKKNKKTKKKKQKKIKDTEKPKKEKVKKERKRLFFKKKEKKEEEILPSENVVPALEEPKVKKSYHIFSYILLFLFAVFIGLLIYCILYIYGVGSFNDGLEEEIFVPAELKDKGNFTEIMGTEIFNQTENEYFVLLYKKPKKEKHKYYRFINEYTKREYRFYFVDLSNEENKFLYAPNDLNFTLYTDRFLKVKEKEFEYYVDGKKNILNEMQRQIDEIVAKEKEEEKQAKMQRKREQLESIAISMADNKKDTRPVTRKLVKAAKIEKEYEKYALAEPLTINYKIKKVRIKKDEKLDVDIQKVFAKGDSKEYFSRNIYSYKLNKIDKLDFDIKKTNLNDCEVEFKDIKVAKVEKTDDLKNYSKLKNVVAYTLKKSYNIKPKEYVDYKKEEETVSKKGVIVKNTVKESGINYVKRVIKSKKIAAVYNLNLSKDLTLK